MRTQAQRMFKKSRHRSAGRFLPPAALPFPRKLSASDRGKTPDGKHQSPQHAGAESFQTTAQAGFTLVELVVVMVIVATLTAIIIPVFGSMTFNHNQNICMNNLRTLGVELAQYRQDYNAYPAAPLPMYLSPSDPLQAQKYLPFASVPVSANIASTSSVNEVLVTGGYTGSSPATDNVVIQIVALGSSSSATVDQFAWSIDVATAQNPTWDGPHNIGTEALRVPYGVSVQLQHQLGHHLGDTWTITFAHPDNFTFYSWQQPSPTYTTSTASVGATTLYVQDATVFTQGIPYVGGASTTWYPATINYPDGTSWIVTAKYASASALTLKTYTPLLTQLPAGSIITPEYQHIQYSLANGVTPKLGNFGLFTVSLANRQNKLFDASLYHCPQITETGNNQTNNHQTAAQIFTSRLDPLQGGYNTYDLTYNYDQFANDIANFDGAMGFGDLNSVRQLKNPYPPGDTVACWCYGHEPGQNPSASSPNPAEFNDPTTYTIGNTDHVYEAEKEYGTNKALVLWVDGTVDIQHPYALKSNYFANGGSAYSYVAPTTPVASGCLYTAGVTPIYCWVPHFLYSPGVWRP